MNAKELDNLARRSYIISLDLHIVFITDSTKRH